MKEYFYIEAHSMLDSIIYIAGICVLIQFVVLCCVEINRQNKRKNIEKIYELPSLKIQKREMLHTMPQLTTMMMNQYIL